MIKIRKSAPPPEILATKGRKESASNKQRMTRDPRSYKEGKKRFAFDSSIYGDTEVKSQAKADQFGKCCYCESKLSHVYHGDMEHFRPKGSIRSGRKIVRKYGYYWLAYSWENLLFSCALCNQTHKRDAFPLKREKQRAKSHHADLAKEEPLLINPLQDDPEDFLSFRNAIIFAKEGSKKGETSIRVLGLDRADLEDQRREHFAKIRLIWNSVLLLRSKQKLNKKEKALLKEAEALLENAKRPNAAFSAMIKAAVASGFGLA